MHSNLGQKIKSARKAAGMTQRQLADKLHKSFSTIQKYENGVVEPPISFIPEIAAAIGITPLELMETAIAWPSELQALIDSRDRRTVLNTVFDQLNPDGQQKAIERLEELIEIPKYQKEPPQD